jgi:cytidylate kinase
MTKITYKKFRNITISGKIAVGTTTLFNGLKEFLQPQGWNFFSAGEYMRNYAVENHLFPKNSSLHHGAKVYSDEFDKDVDHMIRKKLREEVKLVIEADLAGFMTRDIEDVLRILLVCDDALRIDRLVNRDKLAVEQAKIHLREREEGNIEKWKKLYGNYDFWCEKFYSLVIDTYKNSSQETLNLVLKKLES